MGQHRRFTDAGQPESASSVALRIQHRLVGGIHRTFPRGRDRLICRFHGAVRGLLRLFRQCAQRI